MNESTSILQRVKAIVGEALELPESERGGFLDARCHDDERLRAEADSLLAAAASTGALLHPDADAWVGASRVGFAAPVAGRLGGFEIIRLIAQGPASAVYEARQARPERTVALKVLHALPLLGPDPRFWLEAAAAARVEHPNVVRIYEVGVLEAGPGHRAPYIAMELVDGVAITAYARGRGLGVWEIVSLLLKVAAGVARVHQCGVIHRDLKPSNVLVDAGGEPRVLDFGVARLVSGPDADWRTQDGVMLGTPGYISPEQVERPAEVDVRADVWALGAMAYELLAGRVPFDPQESSALDAMRRVVNEDPPPLRRIAPHVPADLEAVVMKALAREPRDRYDSVLAFAEDLENARACLPVRARRGTVVYRASVFARRRAAALLVGAGLLAGVIAVGAGQVASWREAARERDRAVAVIELLRGMISSADPNFGHRDVLMRDALAGVEARLDAGLSDHPLTLADVRSLMGRLCFALAEYERSRAHLEGAIALRMSAGAGETPEAVSDAAALAQTLRWLYEPLAAEKIAAGARDTGVKRLGARHPATLDAREALAGCWHDLRRTEVALQEYTAVLAAREKIQGPAGEGTLACRANRASLLSDMGRYEQSEAELREILRLRAELNPGSLESLTARTNLAGVVAEQGRLEEAVSLLRETLSGAGAALGPTHPTTLVASGNLIEFLRRMGHEDRAMALAEEQFEHCLRHLGWSHDLTANALSGYVSSLIRAGEAARALGLTTRAVAECGRTLPPENAVRVRASSMHAAALAAAGRFEEAETVYREAVNGLGMSLGPPHRQTLTTRNNMAVAMIDAGEAARARAELRAVLDAVREQGYAEMEGVVQRNLGRALLESGDLAGAGVELAGARDLSLSRQESGNAAVCEELLKRWRALHRVTTSRVEPLPALSALFRAEARWRGGDCASTVDLGHERTLWLMGDSFIAPEGGASRAGSRMIRNSIAVQTGHDPSRAQMRFYWRTGTDGAPGDFFPFGGDRWLWPGSGVRVGEVLLLFLIEVKAVSGGLGFETAGSHAVLIENPDDDPLSWRSRVVDVPANPWGVAVGFGALVVEGEMLVSLSPREPGDKAVFALRWPLARAAAGDLALPQWWTGAGWSERVEEAGPRPLWRHGQTEFSVHFDAALGQYIAVSVDGFGSTNIIARVGAGLTGPWSSPVVLTRPPESSRRGVLVYSAKAHAHLGGGRGGWVITYASNTLDFGALVADETLYYPHCVLVQPLTADEAPVWPPPR